MELTFGYIMFWVCIIGLCCGSFYNVVILRSLNDESIVFPPSKCPKCNHKLYWWHNIPVISYILLRGKCYFCHEKISIQYPFIELLTMAMFALTYIKFGFEIKTLFVMFWISCLIIMTTTDFKAKLVDCNIAIIMAISGIVYAFINNGLQGLWYSFLGILAGVIIIEAVARLGYIFAGTRAMGEADSYVAGALGAIAGIFNIIPVLLYALFAAMIFIIPMYLYKSYKNNEKKVCILMILFLLSVAFFKSVNQSLVSLAVLMILGILLAFSVIKSMKRESELTYLPYVPALSCAALYFIMSM